MTHDPAQIATGPLSIVFTDLDGTFLTTDKRVHPTCRAALEALQEHQVPFVICTGRAFSGVYPELRALPALSYIIACNGAVVVNATTSQELHATPLGHKRARQLFDAVAHLDVNIDFFADGCAYAEKDRFSKLDTYGLEPHFLAQTRRSRRVVESLVELLDQVGRVDRMSVYYHTPGQRRAVLEAAEAMGGLTVTSSEFCNLEISDKEANKGAAACWLCDYLGIPVEEAAAFGDGLNDTPMLAALGDGVAMANAQPGVAGYADHITALVNDEGGVGEYLLRRLAAFEGI